LSQSVSTPSPVSQTSILRAAGTIGAATLLSRVLGLVREQVFAVYFGAGNWTDAFNLAFRIPNLLRNLLAEGALSAALVPTLTRVRQERGVRAGWRLASLVFRLLFAVVAGLALLGWLFAPQLVGLYASAFREIPGKFELAVRLTRLLFPFFPFVALAAAFMAVLNAGGVFFVPAMAPALFNLVSIVVGVALIKLIQASGPRSGWIPIEGMAIGVLAGGLVQAACQVPALLRAGYHRPKPRPSDPHWSRDPDLRRMLVLMTPALAGLAATQLNLFTNTVLATRLGPGAVSYLSYAFRLMQFPIGIFGASLAQAALPRISELWVRRDLGGLERVLSENLRRSFALNLPASAGLAFLGVPIIQLVFQYGRFYPEDAQATAWALAMYSIGLTAYAVVKLLVPACYALGNARVPVISSLVSVATTLVLNLLMYRPLRYGGLALGTSLGAVVNALFLYFAVRRMLAEAGGRLDGRALGGSFLKHLGIALAMGGVCWGCHWMLDQLLPAWRWGAAWGTLGWVSVRVIKVGIVMGIGVGIVIWAGKRLGAHETAEAADIFAKKVKNMLSRPRT
jgi:putative peptidoglycan lipid II flippase